MIDNFFSEPTTKSWEVGAFCHFMNHLCINCACPVKSLSTCSFDNFYISFYNVFGFAQELFQDLQRSHKCTHLLSVFLFSSETAGKQLNSFLICHQSILCTYFGCVMLAFCKTIQLYVVSIAKFILYLYTINKFSPKHTYL